MKIKTAYVFILAVILLILPGIIRYYGHNMAVAGENSYFNLRIAQSNNFLKFNDEKIFGGRIINISPYHIILNLAISVLGVKFGSFVFPIILGIISLFLFYHLLKYFGFEDNIKNISCLLVASSPAFVYIFNTLNIYSFSLTMIIAGLFFYSKQKWIWDIISLLFFVSTLFFGWIFAAIIIFILIIYSLKNTLRTVIYAVIILGAYLGLFFSGMMLYLPNYQYDYFRETVSALGGNVGLPAFLIFLSIIGLVLRKENKRKFIPAYIFIAFLIIISAFFDFNINIYLNFILSCFAAFAIINLSRMKWDLDLVKDLTMLILVCGLLFSYASFSKKFVELKPSPEFNEGLNFLEKLPQGTVLSHKSNGFFIENSGKWAVIDYLSTSKEIINDSSTIFYSRNLPKTEELLKKYNITYIFIDNEMKNGLVWSKEDEGLLFLFNNNETFKNLYRVEDIEIWKYTT